MQSLYSRLRFFFTNTKICEHDICSWYNGINDEQAISAISNKRKQIRGASEREKERERGREGK